MFTRVLAAMLIVVLSACATTGSGGRSGGNRLITDSEIKSSGGAYVTAYDIIERLRPNWPREGNPSCGSNCVAVYWNKVKFGGLEELRNVRAYDVYEIELLDAARAMSLGRNPRGAIVIRTGRGN